MRAVKFFLAYQTCSRPYPLQTLKLNRLTANSVSNSKREELPPYREALRFFYRTMLPMSLTHLALNSAVFSQFGKIPNKSLLLVALLGELI